MTETRTGVSQSSWVASALLTLALVTSSASAPPAQTRPKPGLPTGPAPATATGGQTNYVSAPIVLRPLTAASLTVADLRDYSGLSASQLALLFGVSRRSVNNWLAGGAMAPHHADRRARIQSFLMSLNGSTPALRRAALLSSANGRSLYRQLADEIPEGPVIHGNSLSARDQFQS
ncbi:MAG: hypothetical protein LBG60_09235 [Bifidobacteriaceae bacterium]|jgi:transcriptional regulator with XRE-family HTH domain|nr:hypothetical protein [Bifidobacteriaceae bacterium]